MAGSIAHDFNNMMAVISGYLELTLYHLTPETPARTHAEAAAAAADRASLLTRELLNFRHSDASRTEIVDLSSVIQGIAGIPVTEQRSQGFRDALKRKCQDGVKIVASQPADFVPDKGLSVMENILQAQKDIDAVYTHDDDMAEGVVSAIQNAGREDEMFLTGAGGSKAAMEQIKGGGLYRATFLYNPNMAATAVNMGRLLALGEGFPELVPPEVPRQLVVPAAVVTKDNVDDYEQYAFN